MSRNSKQPLLSPSSTTSKIIKYVADRHPKINSSLQDEDASSAIMEKNQAKKPSQKQGVQNSAGLLDQNQILKNMRKTSNTKMAGFDAIWKEQQEKFKVLQR